MSRMTYFPRLTTQEASASLVEYSHMAVEAVQERVTVSLDGVAWYPTAPAAHRVKISALQAFRDEVLTIAKVHGYPKSGTKGNVFDRELVESIGKLLDLQPVEAADESVWNFLSLVIAPDIALWRWPNTKLDPLYERIIGRPRNVFRRLWWRSYVFGTGTQGVGAKLYEDEAVAILERTLIGGNAYLSKVIAQTHVARNENRERRTEVLRDVMKRVRRLHGFMYFHAMSPAELKSVVESMFDEADRAMTESS